MAIPDWKRRKKKNKVLFGFLRCASTRSDVFAGWSMASLKRLEVTGQYGSGFVDLEKAFDTVPM